MELFSIILIAAIIAGYSQDYGSDGWLLAKPSSKAAASRRP
jgi:hypothetical protein